MLFKEIIGQTVVKQRLVQMIDEGKMPHALMFSGAQGVGKLPLAIATAQYICCENRSNGDACGHCRSCLQFAKMSHPDVNYVFPIVKSKEAGVAVCDDVIENFRETLINNPYTSVDEWLSVISDGKVGTIYTEEGHEILKKVNFKPYQGDYKVIIIWIPEKMHVACANSILKVLEEPPLDTLFLLVSDKPDLVLGTIISRCQQMAVSPINRDDMAAFLCEQYEIDEAQMHYLLRNSMGSWNRLQNLMNQSDEMKQNFQLFVTMMRLAWTLPIPDIREWSIEVDALGREGRIRFLQNAQRLIRENFMLCLQCDDLNYMSSEERAFAQKFSQFIHESNVVQIVEELSLAEEQITQNGNAKIILFHLVFVLYRLLKKPRVAR